MYPNTRWLFSSFSRFLLQADLLPMWTVDLNLTVAWVLKVLVSLIIAFIKEIIHLNLVAVGIPPVPHSPDSPVALVRCWEWGHLRVCSLSAIHHVIPVSNPRPGLPVLSVLIIPRSFPILSVRWTQTTGHIVISGLVLTHSPAHTFSEKALSQGLASTWCLTLIGLSLLGPRRTLQSTPQMESILLLPKTGILKRSS